VGRLCGGVARRDERRAGEDDGGQERARQQCPSHLLEHHGELDRPVAVAAVLGRQGERLQAELLGHLAPHRLVVAPLGLHDAAHLLLAGPRR